MLMPKRGSMLFLSVLRLLSSLTLVQFSGSSLPLIPWGRHRSALFIAGPRAEERWHKQTAHSVGQHTVCVRNVTQTSSTFIWQPKCQCLLKVFFVCSRRWSADEARILRVSVNSFLDHLSLVLETMEMFGSPVSQWRLKKCLRTHSIASSSA